MPQLNLTGPREEVAERLEELVDRIRDEDEDDPSIAIMPNDAGGSMYLSYDPSTSDDERMSFTFER